MQSKRCRICGQVQPLDHFHRATGMRDGHRNECKTCFRAIARARYQADPQSRIEAARAWQAANPERVREARRRRNQSPDRKRALRDGYYRRTYGISADEVDQMLTAQGGGCAVCGIRPERFASMHLDHDHEHQHLRGLLCVSCNQGLGQFRDDPTLLLAAAEYLHRTRRPSLGRPVASLGRV